MSEIDSDIDGYPTFEAEKLRLFDAIQLIAYEAIQHSIENGSASSFVTWVDTEDSWDGHAIVLCHPNKGQVAMQYFHINRDQKHLIQHSRMDLDVSSIDLSENGDESDEDDDIKTQIEEAGREFDTETSLLYTLAMLGKMAHLGADISTAPKDAIVRSVITEEKLPELAILFPTAKKEKLPYVSDEFLIEARKLMTIQQLEEGKNDIFLKKTFEREEYIIHLQFVDGKLHYGIFIQEKDGRWAVDHHHYVEDDPHVVGLRQGWDLDRLIRTVQRGPEISQDTFDSYCHTASNAEAEDYHERFQRGPMPMKRRTSEDSLD